MAAKASKKASVGKILRYTPPKPKFSIPFIPSGDRVLVRRSAAEAKTPAGIVLPDESRQAPNTGTLLVAGEGSKHSDYVGSLVLFSSYGGTVVKVNSEELVLLSDIDIMGYFQ